MLGLALQAAAALYCGARYGLLRRRLAACPVATPGAASLLRPWEALAPLRAAACWVLTIGDVLLGVRRLLSSRAAHAMLQCTRSLTLCQLLWVRRKYKGVVSVYVCRPGG